MTQNQNESLSNTVWAPKQVFCGIHRLKLLVSDAICLFNSGAHSRRHLLDKIELFKLVSATFYQIFIFHQMIAIEKLWKMFFISSKKLFLFLRYSNFCIFVFPSFFPVSHCFRGWFQENRKVYDVIICLNKNFITRFVWYLEKGIRCDIDTLSIDGMLNTEHFLRKNHAENVHQKLAPNPFLILLNNTKQILHAGNSFENKKFWKMII